MTLCVGWNRVKILTPHVIGLPAITLLAKDVIRHEVISKLAAQNWNSVKLTLLSIRVFIMPVSRHILLHCCHYLIQRIEERPNSSWLSFDKNIPVKTKTLRRGQTTTNCHRNYCSPLLLTRVMWASAWFLIGVLLEVRMQSFCYCAFLIVQAELVDCTWSLVKAWLGVMVLPY